MYLIFVSLEFLPLNNGPIVIRRGSKWLNTV